ncbi:MAG: thiamine ABC transporter ATP-binding protein [Arenicellales bacterium WSBS_2016_MAG_OTU3]
MLEVCDLEFHYPTALIQSNFTVATGNSVALMGASGSGKSTILNVIAGFLEPAKGDIRCNGQSILALKPAQRPLTFLFQAHNLFPHLTVWQNVAIGVNPGLKISATQKQDIQNALDWVALPGFENRSPMDLSGGQQQRVALARCLLRNKPLLLLDEPFSALDQTLRNEMIELIKRLQHEQRLTLVLSTHQQQDADALNAEVFRVGDEQ